MPITMKTGKEARAEILSGVKQLNDAVSTSLGPAGRWTLFRHGPMVVLTKDGVTISNEINLPGVYESMGADRMKGAARQAVNESGDGTTTAVLLGHAIYEAGCKAIDAGAEPVKLTRGIQRAVKAIVGDYDPAKKKFSGGILETLAIPCTPELAFQAARISANGDDAIAKAVSEVVLKVGVDGDVTIANSFSQEHSVEFQEGMGVNTGTVHPGFVNDAYRNRTVLEKAMVLVINRQISTAVEAVNIMKKAAGKSKSDNMPFSLLVIADEYTPEALNQFLHHRKPQNLGGDGLEVAVVRAPLWKDDRRDLLEDICLLTRGTRIENPQGKALEQISVNAFGTAERVIVTQSRTTITAAVAEDAEEYKNDVIDPYLARLTTMSEDTSLRPDQVSNLKARLAALTGGVAIIKVGGTSVNDVEKLKFQVEDAIHATRAAVADGVVPGGGSALLFARESLLSPEDDSDEEQGFNLLLLQLHMPIGQIAANAGYDRNVVVGGVLAGPADGAEANDRNGFDASTGLYPNDMFTAGIVDPLRVVRSSLNAAASEACLLLLTEVVLGAIPEEAPKQMTGQIPGRR
jgi:chaperonin GroEL